MTTQPTTRWVPVDTLGARVVLIRHSLGLSQREAAMQCGITYGAWQGIEDGRSPRDLAGKVARICTALGVDREWLMWGGPLAPPNTDGDPGGNKAGPTFVTPRNPLSQMVRAA